MIGLGSDKKGYNRRLIEYGHLVLGTRSAAKFEQVPSSNDKAPVWIVLKKLGEELVAP